MIWDACWRRWRACPGSGSWPSSWDDGFGLYDTEDTDDAEVAMQPRPDASAIAKLRSLTKLELCCFEAEPYPVAGVVGALVSLTGLMELTLDSPHPTIDGQPTVLPAAVGQLKGLRSLVLTHSDCCGLEAGCLELPNLLHLEFAFCSFADAKALPGATALQNLTGIRFTYCKGLRFFDHQLARLLRLQHMGFETDAPPQYGACPWLHPGCQLTWARWARRWCT